MSSDRVIEEMAKEMSVSLGALVLALMSKGYLVKIQFEANLLGSRIIRMVVIDMKRRTQVGQLFSEEQLATMHDPRVIADRLHEELKKPQAKV